MMDEKILWIYRMLHIENLKLLLDCGGLNSSNSVSAIQRTRYHNIYNSEIQSGRGNVNVPNFSPHTTVHDFIPFYFCPASPMLYAITRGSGDKTIPSDEIIYLVADAHEISKSKTFVFTNCNARLRFVEWYYDMRDLPKLKWNCINAKYWGRNNDPSGFTKQYKMAEFLVKDWLEWGYIKMIAVHSDAAYREVMRIMVAYAPNLHRNVIIKPGWYY